MYANSLVFGGGEFVCSGYINGSGSGGVLSSPDGYSWTKVATTIYSTNAIAYGQGTFIGCSGYNVYQSGTVAVPSNPPPANLAISTYPGITISGTPGLTYLIQYSTTLNSNWSTLTNLSLPYSPYLWIDTSATVAGQRYYRSIQFQ